MPLILLCAYFAGNGLYSELAEREKLLSELCRFINDAAGDIRVSLMPLDRITERYARGDAPEFLKACAARLRSGESFPEAWRYAVNDSPDMRLLKERERLELGRLGDELGCSDVKGELALLDRASVYFCARRDAARAELGEKSKLYMSCSLLVGLTVVLLLL